MKSNCMQRAAYAKSTAHSPTRSFFRRALPILATLLAVGGCGALIEYTTRPTRRIMAEIMDMEKPAQIAPVESTEKMYNANAKGRKTGRRLPPKLRNAIIHGIAAYVAQNEKKGAYPLPFPTSRILTTGSNPGFEMGDPLAQISYETEDDAYSGIVSIAQIYKTGVRAYFQNEEGSFDIEEIPFDTPFHISIQLNDNAYMVLPMEFKAIEGSDTAVVLVPSCKAAFSIVDTETRMRTGTYTECGHL